MQTEKRKYPRVVLAVEDGFFGAFQVSEKQTLHAPIVNLSAGGLNMALPKQSAEAVRPGNRLVLVNISGATNLQFLSQVTAEVRWIKDLDQKDYLSAGCEFTDLDNQVREQIARFVDSERVARGQYG